MRLITAVAVLIASASLCARVCASPSIQFERTSVDFGKPLSGEVVKLEFPFKNIGDKELAITDVKASCSCTLAKTADMEVAPGKSGVIRAEFRSAGYTGQVAKSIAVSTNDPSQPMVILRFTGEPVPLAVVSPDILVMGNLKTGEVAERDVVLTPAKGHSFRILRIEPSGTQVTAAPFGKTPGKSGTIAIKVRVVAWDSPSRIREHLKIVTDLPGNPSLLLLVYGNVVKG